MEKTRSDELGFLATQFHDDAMHHPVAGLVEQRGDLVHREWCPSERPSGVDGQSHSPTEHSDQQLQCLGECRLRWLRSSAHHHCAELDPDEFRHPCKQSVCARYPAGEYSSGGHSAHANVAVAAARPVVDADRSTDANAAPDPVSVAASAQTEPAPRPGGTAGAVVRLARGNAVARSLGRPVAQDPDPSV